MGLLVVALSLLGGSAWVLGFNNHVPIPEGSPLTYSSMILAIQWIAELPEPRSIMFLGAALLVVSGFARRRLAHHDNIQKS